MMRCANNNSFSAVLLISLAVFAFLPLTGYLFSDDGLTLAYGFYVYIPGLIALPVIFGIVLGRTACGEKKARITALAVRAAILSLLHMAALCIPLTVLFAINGIDISYAFHLFHLLSALEFGIVFFVAALIIRIK